MLARPLLDSFLFAMALAMGLIGSIGVVCIAALLPFTPMAKVPVLGFEPLPATLYLALFALILGYLVLTEIAKHWFYQRLTTKAQMS